MQEEKSVLATLKIALIVSILLHILTAVFSIGYHQGDEHYQLLEFAGLKLGFNQPSELAWEFHCQMRPAIQPLVSVIGIKTFNFLSITNPYTQAILFRIVSAFLALFSTLLFVKAFLNDFTSPVLKKWFIIGSFFLWCIVYADVRFSSEGWSGSFIVMGIALLKGYLDGKINQRKTAYLLLTGLIIGFSFVCRYQTGFFIAGLALWLTFVKRERLPVLVSVFSGVLLAVTVGILIDYWFYGMWSLTSVNYFVQNIVHNKASNYGVSPWWYYFTNLLEDGYVVFGLLSLIAMGIIIWKNPKNIFVWTIIPFVVVHSLVGHKEARFLFPMLKFAPYLVLFAYTLIDPVGAFLKTRLSKIVVYSLIAANAILIPVSCFVPADYLIAVTRYIGSTYSEPVHLYYTDNNPYENYGLYCHFYMTKNVSWEKINTPEALQVKEAGKTLLVTTNKKPVKDTLGITFQKVYQPYPKMVTDLFSTWAARHTMPVVYESRKVSGRKE